jgi:hypothetical protein
VEGRSDKYHEHYLEEEEEEEEANFEAEQLQVGMCVVTKNILHSWSVCIVTKVILHSWSLGQLLVVP